MTIILKERGEGDGCCGAERANVIGAGICARADRGPSGARGRGRGGIGYQGTTAAALETMIARGFKDAVGAGLDAALAKGRDWKEAEREAARESRSAG
ncbi:MAG: hypothetical protein HYU58_05570 [Proteobacteria bacterium]|nr:hypothetical protein [Pseudomonadota bacterium]